LKSCQRWTWATARICSLSSSGSVGRETDTLTDGGDIGGCRGSLQAMVLQRAEMRARQRGHGNCFASVSDSGCGRLTWSRGGRISAATRSATGACCRSCRESRRRGRGIGGGCRVIARPRSSGGRRSWIRLGVRCRPIFYAGLATRRTARIALAGEEQEMPPTPRAGPGARGCAVRGRAVRDEECLSAHARYD
jgi:hypothetical protein